MPSIIYYSAITAPQFDQLFQRPIVPKGPSLLTNAWNHLSRPISSNHPMDDGGGLGRQNRRRTFIITDTPLTAGHSRWKNPPSTNTPIGNDRTSSVTLHMQQRSFGKESECTASCKLFSCDTMNIRHSFNYQCAEVQHSRKHRIWKMYAMVEGSLIARKPEGKAAFSPRHSMLGYAEDRKPLRLP